MTRPKKENIETNLVEAKFDSSPEYFERFQKNLASFRSEKNLNRELPFQQIWFQLLAYIHLHMMDLQRIKRQSPSRSCTRF